MLLEIVEDMNLTVIELTALCELLLVALLVCRWEEKT